MNYEEARKILGLTGGVTSEDIRLAFRRMALRYHPDRYQMFTQKAWATRHFIKIKEAYDLLINSIPLDSIKRDQYSESFQEKETFYEGTKAKKTKKIDEDSRSSFSLFEWVIDKIFPKEKSILEILMIPIMVPVMLFFVYYGFIIFILQEILEKFGIKVYSDSPSKRERFVYLLIITVPSISFFVLPWRVITHFGVSGESLLKET